jgi:hypothetical protein
MGVIRPMAQACTSQRVPRLMTSFFVASRRSTTWVVPSPWQRPPLWVANPPNAIRRRRTSSATGIPSSPSLGEALHKALRALHWVLRNSLTSSAAAWVFALCFSSGAWIVTGRGPACQSRTEFLVAHTVWFSLSFAVLALLNVALRLLPERFVDERVPTFSVVKLARILRLMAARGALIHALLAVGCDVLLSLVLHASRAGIYVSAMCTFHVLASSDAVTREVFRTRTVRGRMPRSPTARPGRLQIKVKQVAETASAPVGVGRPRPLWRLLLRSWRALLPLVFSSLLAIGYVHAATVLVLTRDTEDTSRTRIVLFVAGSLVLKVATQEGAKRLLLERNQSPAQDVAMTLIATPTLLIDIQVRVVLLQLGSSVGAAAAAGTAALAVVEIVARLAKMLLLRRELQRTWHPFTTPVHIRPARRVHHLAPETNLTAKVVTSESTRKQRLLALHAAETYADMYAEYLALGCSYAVLVVFSNNPHYHFAAFGSSSNTFSTEFWVLLALQLGTELAVDIVASTVEALLGLDIQVAAQHTWAAAGYMVLLAFVNVGICARLFINE